VTSNLVFGSLFSLLGDRYQHQSDGPKKYVDTLVQNLVIRS
jgi:hypothetical protein